jgi:2-C-methyl-D-erythritol 4-phosphate cytidylyltransferase
MTPQVRAIIAAGGSGKRFYGNLNVKRPKQYLKLNGEPVILYSLRAFQKSRLIHEIVVSASPDYFDYLHSLCTRYGISKVTQFTEGGRTRFNSVKKAFLQIKSDDEDLIVIHDAARPNVSPQFIDRLISHALIYGNVIPGIRINSTVKRSRGNFVTETIDRKNLWEIQTPQVFRYNVLRNSYMNTKLRNFTDESSMVEHSGFKVRVCEGYKGNIKITDKSDLSLLKLLIKKTVL